MMIKVARYSTKESAHEALETLRENGIQAEVLDANSNARSWIPYGSSLVSDYWILADEKDQVKAMKLLEITTGDHAKIKSLSRQFERRMLVYLLTIALGSIGLSMLGGVEGGAAIVISIAITTIIAWWMNNRNSRRESDSRGNR